MGLVRIGTVFGVAVTGARRATATKRNDIGLDSHLKYLIHLE